MSFKELAPNAFMLDEAHPVSQLLRKTYKCYTRKYSPRDLSRFADVSSVTETPEMMKAIRDLLVARYRAMPQPPTHILGFDARGFLFGPMIAVELGIPFVLMRKADKNAGLLLRSEPYEKEYKEEAPEYMTIRYNSINKGDRVVLIDDVLATGGTALSGLQLVEARGAHVVEMVALLYSLPFLKAAARIHALDNCRYKNVRFVGLLLSSNFTAANIADPKNYNGPRVLSCHDVKLLSSL